MRMLPKRYDIDSMFDSFLTPSVDMKCDIYEKDDKYYIEADMPGMNKADINVDYDNGYLTISASKSTKDEESTKDYIRQERFYGSMERKFYVGDVDESLISANFKDGVLKIEVPKDTIKKNTTKIDIQ